MSKINHNDLHRQFLGAMASNSTQPAAGAVSTDPRRTIQAIQSGVVAKAAVNELNRALSFANAIGQNFAAVLPSLNEQTRIEVISALACAASAKDRRTIMEHPLCPPARWPRARPSYSDRTAVDPSGPIWFCNSVTIKQAIVWD